MKNKKEIFSHIILLIFMLCWVTSCKKNDPTIKNNNETTPFHLYLADVPGDYQAVWINIQQVLVKASSHQKDNSGWIQIPLTHDGKFNLLHFRNGRDTLMGSAYLPPGNISQIRLILGNDNKLVLNDGSVVSLEIPSALKTGLKLDLHADLTPGVTCNLILDFDVNRSIVKKEKSDTYLLNPVMRAFVKNTGGAIEGTILPDSARTHVIAIGGTDTLNTIPNSSGYYKFRGLQNGIYRLFFIASTSTGFANDTLNNILVTEGRITTLDTIWLTPLEPDYFLSL